MERKDLLVLYAHNCGEGEEGYLASEANQVMDAYEARIKELEGCVRELKLALDIANNEITRINNYSFVLEERLATYEQADGSKPQGENVKTKELEEELKEREQICKDLASQPCGYLTGDK